MSRLTDLSGECVFVSWEDGKFVISTWDLHDFEIGCNVRPSYRR